MASLQTPILEGPRLRLEPLSRSHSAGMFELWSEAAVCEHSGTCIDTNGDPIELPASSACESDRMLQFWLDRAQAGTGFRWAAVLREGSKFVGAAGFNSLGARSEYAYHFVPRHWGAGLATEASRLALDWCFAWGAESIEAFIEPANLPSIRLAERLGFEEARTPPGEPVRYILALHQARLADHRLGRTS